MRWIDEELDGEGWIDWKPFKHPQFGDIEIGGNYTKFVRRTPPARYLEEHCLKNMRFHLYVASELPKLELTKSEFTPLYSFTGSAATHVVKTSANINAQKIESKSGVIGWLDLEIKNFGAIPTATAQAVKIKAVRSDKLIIEGSKNIEILGRANPPNSLGKVTNFKAETSNEIEVGYLDGRSSKSYRLLVKVNSAKDSFITVKVNTQRGGKLTKKVPVQFGAL